MDERPGPMKPKRIEILGVPVDAVTMTTALDHVREMIHTGDKTQAILAVNPEKVIAAQKNQDLVRTLRNASLVVPDGIGVVFAARLLGKGSIERVPGSDLMPEICRMSAKEGYRVFLYGAKPDIAARAAMVLQQRYPGLQVAGVQHGYVPEEEMDQFVETINSSGAEVLFVGLGSPRQEYWMERFRDRLNIKVCQGVGGTFDALCGYPKRAPLLFRKLNLEWLYRLATQPKRANRQIALPRFAAQVLMQVLGRR